VCVCERVRAQVFERSVYPFALLGRQRKRSGRETLNAPSSSFINYYTQEGCGCHHEQMVSVHVCVCVCVCVWVGVGERDRVIVSLQI